MVEMGAPQINLMGKIEQGVVAIMAKNRETSIQKDRTQTHRPFPRVKKGAVRENFGLFPSFP
jgi:hypothetical protein